MRRRLEHLITLITSYLAVVSAALAVVSMSMTRRTIDSAFKSENLYLIIAVLSAGAGAVSSLYMLKRLRERRNARRVFIIYAQPDLESAKELSNLLKERGFAPWLDEEQLLPGQVWKKEVERALYESGTAIVLVSSNLLNSTFALAELTTALKLLRSDSDRITPVIPVRLDDTPPPDSLADIQWVDIGAADAQDRLIRGLEMATSMPRTRPVSAS